MFLFITALIFMFISKLRFPKKVSIVTIFIYVISYQNVTLFSGRGNNTHAYTHSVSDGHHVFLNLLTLRFYCLPDNYEIIGEFSVKQLVSYIVMCGAVKK